METFMINNYLSKVHILTSHYMASGKNVYHKDPELSDRQVLANRVDPDQEQSDEGPHCL